MTYTAVINLIVAPIIISLLFIYALIKIIRDKSAIARRSMTSMVMTAFYVVSMLIILGIPQLDVKDIIQIVLTVGLVTATVFYAVSANRQADASVKMAEEMRDARYDALRPIIDFRFRDSESRSGGALGIGARGEVPSELHGQLCNIGVGPAIDLYSFSKVNQVNRPRYDFEALRAGELSHQVALSVDQEGSIGILEAYYRDVYGNPFRSRIEIHPIEGQGLRTKLQVEKVQEDEK